MNGIQKKMKDVLKRLYLYTFDRGGFRLVRFIRNEREAAASWVLNLESFIGAASNSGIHPTAATKLPLSHPRL